MDFRRIILISFLCFANIASAEIVPKLSDLGLSNAKGDILIEFWASWCDKCLSSVEEVKNSARNIASKGGQFISISVDSDETAARKFADKHLKGVMVIFDKDSKLVEKFNPQSLPAFYLFNSKGILQKAGYKIEDIQPISSVK